MMNLIALFSAAAISACPTAQPPKSNIEHLLGNARTASDHDAIADYYEKEAADAKVKYQEHEALAIRYERVGKLRTWSWHCEHLAHDFYDAEQDASALAAEHRKIAAEMKSGGQSSAVSSPPDNTARPNW